MNIKKLKYSLIGLHGKARVGKDTTGKYLSLVTTYKTYALAEPIKKTVNQLLGWDEHHSDGELKEVVDPYWNVSPRHAYQTFGTDWGRKLIHDNIWLMCAERKFKDYGSLIVTDIRFENEANWIRDNGGIIIHINRNIQTNVKNHESEKGIVFHKNDLSLDNHEGYDELYKNIDKLIDEKLE